MIRRFPILFCALVFPLFAALGVEPGAPHNPGRSPGSVLTHGPMIGHTDTSSAKIWARAAQAGVVRVTVYHGQQPVATSAAEALPGNDLCVVWRVSGLAPGREYAYVIEEGTDRELRSDAYVFRTPPPRGEPSIVRIAVVSCANDRRFPSQPVWTRMVEHGADVIVTLGDTPYIDSTELDVQRQRYRELYSVPELRTALSRTPYVGVWDDHDFGKNDVDGNLPGKEFSRQAFIEYHANASYGDGEHEGVYTRLRWGPVDMFLLDTRWFAATRPSPVSPGDPTLLGDAQWEWLTRELEASTAPFKLIASGMIWNDAVRPNKSDHWMRYEHERDALFRFIGERGISGVVLVGGDIHRSRALRFPTQDVVGYPLTELISSPMANRVIDAANVESPYLLHDVGEGQAFILMTVDTTGPDPKLKAECIDHEGTVHFTVDLDGRDLTAAAGK
jgi:alkaline phosphatase D